MYFEEKKHEYERSFSHPIIFLHIAIPYIIVKLYFIIVKLYYCILSYDTSYRFRGKGGKTYEYLMSLTIASHIALHSFL